MSITLWDWDKKPRTMRRFIKRGDIFCFRYDDNRYCFGRIIELITVGGLVEIFDFISNNPCIDVDTVEKSERLLPPIPISIYDLFDVKREGDWRIIGHQGDYKATDYDNIYLTFGLDGDWKKEDLYGNITGIPDEEHYNYILCSPKMDGSVKRMLIEFFGEPVEKEEEKELKETNKKINNYNYLNIIEKPDSTDVCLDIENPKVMAIGAEMQKKCSDAYMNGYNWEAFWRTFVCYKNSDILETMETDSEAGSFSAIFDGEDEEMRMLAKEFAEIVRDAIENENQIYDFLENHKGEIEWD